MGWVFVIAGVALVLTGGLLTRARVRRAFGEVDEFSMKIAQGSGVVPKWVSLLVLAGWPVALIGVGLLIFG